MRESPTLQLLESQDKHLGYPLKVYDPLITEDKVENQYHNLDEFLKDVDLVVIMVAHDEIKNNFDKLRDKIILDTRHIYDGECYHL
jgi:UDP-N-acetyl-D-mannosaminuronic acid dehydrogenase